MNGNDLIPMLCIGGVILLVLWQFRRPPPGTGPSQLPWAACRLVMLSGVGCCGLAAVLVGLKFWGLALAILAFGAWQERKRWRGTGTAHGTACWEDNLAAKGMLGGKGLILGRELGNGRRNLRQALDALAKIPWSRSQEACLQFAAASSGGQSSGQLIRLSDYCHLLLIGATGSGKGVSFILPWLLSYTRGSCVCFDTKGDLTAISGRWREQMGMRVISLAPFSGSTHSLNPLDAIPKGPMLVDDARALAEAIVVRQGTEHEPHWNEMAVMVITAVLVLVLLIFEGEERSLNSVRDIVSDWELLSGAAAKLKAMGGIPARLGSQVLGLQDKERSGVLSTVGRHMAFLDSERVARSLARTAFDPAVLLKPGTTLFLTIPPDQLEAQRGLLRLWVSTLVRMIGRSGREAAGEVLFLLDEASSLGGLPAVEEALVRGRSGGVRLMLAYQSDSQVRAAFKDKPTLLYDNCATQIYLGATGYETAERISNMLGQRTMMIETFQPSKSRSYSQGGGHNASQTQVQTGTSRSYSEQARALLQPAEVLQLPASLAVIFTRGIAPLLVRRVRYYDDPAFTSGGIGNVDGGGLALAWRAAFGWLLMGAVALGAALAFLGYLNGIRP